QAIAVGFIHYYTGFFWLLSPIFTMVFLCSGFYTHSRSYVGPYKSMVVARSVLIAVMLFFGANFMLFGRERVGRSVALPFVIRAAVTVSAARLLKDALKKAYEVHPKKSGPISAGASRVLVVGGAGYIGSLLVERLLEKNYRVRVLDSLIYGDDALRPVRRHENFEL